MRTLLDRKNISSRTNGQVAARRVTGLIIKKLWSNNADRVTSFPTSFPPAHFSPRSLSHRTARLFGVNSSGHVTLLTDDVTHLMSLYAFRLTLLDNVPPRARTHADVTVRFLGVGGRPAAERRTLAAETALRATLPALVLVSLVTCVVYAVWHPARRRRKSDQQPQPPPPPLPRRKASGWVRGRGGWCGGVGGGGG